MLGEANVGMALVNFEGALWSVQSMNYWPNRYVVMELVNTKYNCYFLLDEQISDWFVDV